MANGLSKIIKRARKANETNILARLAQKKFRVEELEDRIAPAAVEFTDLTKDNILIWDTAADNTVDTADGVLMLDVNSSGFDKMTIANVVQGTTVADTASIALSFTDTVNGAGDATVIIGTNKAISSIDFSGINLGAANTLTVVIVSGTDFTGSGDGSNTLAFTADTTAYTSADINGGTVNLQNFTGSAAADCDVSFAGAVADGTIGAITLPTAGKVNLKIYAGEEAGAGTQANALSTIGAITGAGATLTTGSEIYGTSVASLSVKATEGTVATSAITGALTVAGDVATLSTRGIGGTTTVTGNVTSLTSAAGNIAAVNVTGDVATLSSAGTLGNVTVGGGVTTSIAAVTTIGNVAVTGDIDGTVAGTVIGNVSAANITDTVTASTGAIGNINVTTNVSGAITAATTIGTVDIGGDLSAKLEATAGAIGAIDITGSVTGGGNKIVAGSLANAIDIGGGLTGNVTSAAGIADLGVVGAVNGNITAAGGSLVMTAGSIAATAGVTVQATADVTITLTGGIDGSGGDTIAITADSDTDNDGDLVLTVGNQIDADGDDTINLTGENITFSTTSETISYIYWLDNVIADDSVTIGNIDGDLLATAITATNGSISNITVGGDLDVATLSAPDTDTNNTGSIGNLTAGGYIDITTLTADQAIGNIIADGANVVVGALTSGTGVGNITADTSVELGTVTVTAGGIGDITAGTTFETTGLMTITAGGLGDITAGGNITIDALGLTVTAGGIGNIASEGSIIIDGDVVATAGNIGTITASDGEIINDTEDITIASGKKIEATAGTIGVISATGDIDADAGTATIVAGAQVAVSGVVFSVTDNSVVYEIASDNAVSTDLFAVTFTLTNGGTDNKAGIVSTRSTNTALNLALTTVDLDGEVVADDFDLAGLSFAAATVTAGYNKLNTVTVEGDAASLSFGAGSSIVALLVQDDITGTVSVDSISVIAAANITSLVNADAKTDSATTPGADPNAVAAEGTFALPLSNGGINEVVAAKAAGKFSNDGTSNLSLVTVTGDADLAGSVTYAAGVLTGATGGALTIDDITADTNLSAITGDITITGSVTGDLTFGEDAGNITIGGVGEVISGALTFADMTGSIAITGDVTGTITAGDVTGDVTVTGAVGAAVTLGDVTGTVSLGAGEDVTGNITVGDVIGAGNDLVIGAVGAGVTVSAGEIADDITVGSIAATSTLSFEGSDDITITGDMLGTISSVGDVGDITISGDFGSVISIDGDAGTITLTDDTGDGIVGSATSTLTVTGNMTALNVIDTLGAAVTMEVLFASITIGDGHLTVTNTQGDDVVGLTVPSLSLGITGNLGDDSTGDIVIDGTTYVDVTALDAATFGSLAFDSTATTNAQTLTITNMVLHDANSGGAETIAISSASVGAIYAGDTVDVAITVDDPSTPLVANDGVLGSVTIDDDANIAAIGLDVDGAIYETFNGGAAKISTGANFAITAGSIGAIFAEEALNFNFITATAGGITSITAEAGDITSVGVGISATDGNIGNITSFDDITSDIAVVDGNLGLIVADGNIAGDITVDETYTFAGIINTAGGYAGTFDVEATIGDIMMSGNLNAYGAGDEDDLRDDYVFAADALVSLGADFAMEGYASASLEDVTIVGATTYVTLAVADLTVYNSVAGSSVTVDETDGNIATDVIVDGDLAGTITFLGDINNPGSIVDLTVEGNLSGSFTAQDDIDDLVVEGNWTGSVVLSDSDVYLIGEPNVADIEVWGSVATANLSGATYTEATDKNGIALSAAAPASVTKDAVYLVPNSANDGVGQYVYVTGSGVTATVSSLFGQVSGIELVGKGSTQVISVESDTALEVRDMKAAAKYGQQMIKGRETANDFIDFDNVGTANLPDITVAPRVQITGLTVDGNVGNITDIDSNIKNVFVNGTAGNILAGRGLANGYFGAVGNITAQSITNVDVETTAGAFAASKINKIDVEGTITSASAVSINNLFIGGNITDLSAAKINNAFVSGNVTNELEGAVISNTTVGGNVAQLNVQQNYKGKPSIIKNTILANVGGTNIDFDIDDAVVAGSAVVSLNGSYNPVKIINSYIQL